MRRGAAAGLRGLGRAGSGWVGLGGIGLAAGVHAPTVEGGTAFGAMLCPRAARASPVPPMVVLTWVGACHAW